MVDDWLKGLLERKSIAHETLLSNIERTRKLRRETREGREYLHVQVETMRKELASLRMKRRHPQPEPDQRDVGRVKGRQRHAERLQYTTTLREASTALIEQSQKLLDISAERCQRIALKRRHKVIESCTSCTS